MKTAVFCDIVLCSLVVGFRLHDMTWHHITEYNSLLSQLQSSPQTSQALWR